MSRTRRNVRRGGAPEIEVASGLRIKPRRAWGADLEPVGRLDAEAEGRARFLIVHHSASPNEYGRGDVAPILGRFFRAHTRRGEGWPDVAYNFFVDRFGGIWEGREGSLTRPIMGDTTGGSQGFALLCCFIGDHEEAPPTGEALASMVRLLAWLCDRDGIDPSPGATVRFVSRGSSRWPRGTEVTARTISGHRDMSRTICPGDHVYGLLERAIPTRVAAAL